MKTAPKAVLSKAKKKLHSVKNTAGVRGARKVTPSAKNQKVKGNQRKSK